MNLCYDRLDEAWSAFVLESYEQEFDECFFVFAKVRLSCESVWVPSIAERTSRPLPTSSYHPSVCAEDVERAHCPKRVLIAVLKPISSVDFAKCCNILGPYTATFVAVNLSRVLLTNLCILAPRSVNQSECACACAGVFVHVCMRWFVSLIDYTFFYVFRLWFLVKNQLKTATCHLRLVYAFIAFF